MTGCTVLINPGMKLCSAPLEALYSRDDAPLSKEAAAVGYSTWPSHGQDIAALQKNRTLYFFLMAPLLDGFWTAY